MEAASVEAGGKNHLHDVLSQNEIATLPNPVVHKINSYINQKFEEYLTSKALHETSKSQIDDKIAASEATILDLTTKYEDAAKKLLVAEETITELERQVVSINTELEKTRERVYRLENENISFKSARDAAVDERNDLTRILQRRDAEIERLNANDASLSQQLRAAIDSKCEALALNDEIQSKELSLQYREKRLDQERVLLNSQIASLTEEVNRLTTELQTVRLNNTSRLVSLETQLSEKVEELNAANDTIEQLNEIKKNLNSRAENLTQRLMEQREIENKMSENYKKELDAKTKLADLFKTMHDDAEAKTMELTEGISELQKLLNEATEKYGELETKYKQTEMDHEELMEKKNEIISSLKSELEHANDLLKAATAQNLDMALSDLAPSAATASKLLKSGMSLTQIYSQLVKVTDELSQEKEENRRLNITINKIVQELEEKVPLLQKQKAEYVEVMESNSALTQQIDSLVIECNRLRDDYNESSEIANHYSRENNRLKGELADLGRQVCFLLKEIEHSRGGLLNGDHDASHPANISNVSDNNSSRIISKTLVTFSDIQEMQSNNQKLLRMIRELTDKQEELERHKEQFESGEMESKIEALKQRVTELTEAQDRQTKMVNGLIRQRDMFKKLYHDHMKGKRHELSSVLDTSDLEKGESFLMDTTPDKSPKPANVEISAFEIKFKETEKQLELLKEEYKTYKEEKVTNERMLFEQIDNMRQEIAKLTAANSKCASTSEYNNERLKILQTNIATYKKQICSLEEKNKAYNTTIAKHEVSIQHLRDEILNAQGKLAAAEIKCENLKLENKLLKDAELRLQTEREIQNRERQGQSLLLKNLELIKASLERVEVENRAKIETRLDEATRECSALRRRLQEEQDRFRELAAHLERQTETAKSRMNEEKDASDVLRKEVQQLRDDILNKTKTNEEITKKLKNALSPTTDGSLDAIKRIKELENKLQDRENEIKSLLDQLNTAKEHIKQYCDISESAEKELKRLHDEYQKYKSETDTKLSENAQKLQQLEDKCSELEAELSLQGSGDYSNINVNLKNELEKTKEELKNVMANFDGCRNDLDVARGEISKLSEVVQNAEEKYTHEMILHSTDIQTLSRIKEDLFRAQNQINELVALKNSTVDKMESEKLAWIEREKIITGENDQLDQRLKDLNDQNALLHDQIQALGTQLSVSHASKSRSESINESANESSKNISVGVDDGKSSEILRKVETLNALKNSNRILGEERDTLTIRVDELSTLVKSLEDQLCPLQERISDLTSKNDTFQSENTSLKADCARWTARVNALVERANKNSPEDWKRLQNEQETLAKMLTNEKELSKKVYEELAAIKIEKSKLEEQYTLLSRQHNNIVDENKKLNEELQVLKDDMGRLTEELTKLKSEHNSVTESNNKLTEELSIKKASPYGIRNKVMKILKITKKYKGQFEEKAIQLDSEKANNEKLKQEIETLKTANMDREEEAKQVLKQAKSKIVQLTDLKNNLGRELDESRTKMGSIEQSTRDEQEARLELIKSEYEGRLSRLEKEAQAEKTREIEALMQNVNMLQRQLASQSSASKQQATAEKTTSDPPTANIKPMAGVAQQSVSASRCGGLRKEKGMAMAKFDILQVETRRLKSYFEITEKQQDDCKLSLASEREKSKVSMVTVSKQSDILRKVEMLNVLTDSNRIIREERDTLTIRVNELSTLVKSLKDQLCPLQERISDLTSKNDTFLSENTSLKTDCVRWRAIVNARKKVYVELAAITVKKSKLEEQYTLLSRQHNNIVDEYKKNHDELQVLKNDMARLTEELTKLKSEHNSATESNNKLTEELSSKEASLYDIINKEMQIRKIAKKYKGQYEELVKTVEEEKKRTEGVAAAGGAALVKSTKKVEEQLSEVQSQLDSEKANNEILKQQIETLKTANMDRKEKAKQVYKQAKSKIVQLTVLKNNLDRKLDESRTKIGTIEQSTRDEQEARLELIKYQYEGRLSRLEKEAQTEKNREIEALRQKVNMLQRQLARQSSASKQQATAEKTTSDPPTANIKPMAGVAQQSVSASRCGGLRKEKGMAMAKFDILQAETRRLKSYFEITEKQQDDCKLSLASEREKSKVSMVTVSKQSDILRKVKTLNALKDSNRIIREERDTLTIRVNKLSTLVKSLEDQLCPLQERISDLTSKNDTFQSENTSLKADCAKWSARVNAHKKVYEELAAIKIKKSKLEEQCTLLSRQHNNIVDENKKLHEKLQVLKNNLARLTEELTKLKSKTNSATESNNKLTEELSNEASLYDIINKDMQIRNTAKEYKGKYKKLVQTVKEEKKRTEGDAAAAGVALVESTKKVVEQLSEVQSQLDSEKTNNEKLKQEIETLKTANMEDKAKQVLKQAKSKIVQLTAFKNNLGRELNESRTKIATIEQSTRDEQDARLELIKIQYEGRLSRLEKEAQAEKNREIEALMQKVNMLQMQLASQSSTSKQQVTAEKTTSDPPTANIKPMAGVAQQSVFASRRGGETPLASIRPMAQVGSTAPHDAHSTDYMPASSSRPLQIATLASTEATASTTPPESTQVPCKKVRKK